MKNFSWQVIDQREHPVERSIDALMCLLVTKPHRLLSNA